MSFDPKGEGSRANVDLRLGAMEQIAEVLRNHYPEKHEVAEKHCSPDSAQIGALVRDLLLGQHRWTDNSRWGEYAATVGKAVETALARRAPAQGAQPTGVIEECAKIAESHVGAANNPNYDEACRDIAKAIREELAEVPQGADLTEQQIIDRERYRCVKLCERWIETFNAVDIQYTPPKEYATDAIKDIIDLITDGQDVRDVPQEVPAVSVRLEARPADDSQEWTEIFPAQLEWAVKQGHQVRAIEVAPPSARDVERAATPED